MENEKRKKDMNMNIYYDWTKKIIDEHLKMSDYEKAFFCLANSLSESNNKDIKELGNYFKNNNSKNVEIKNL
tara:strand:- start:11835 stop:12050 length:216 start_codon:yes stop_codon:yes gene_type:complete